MSSAAPQATAHFLSKPPSCTPSTTRTTTYDIPGALALQAPDFFVQSHSIKAQAASPLFAGGPSPPFTTSTPPTPTLTVSAPGDRTREVSAHSLSSASLLLGAAGVDSERMHEIPI
ncbi:hypothetical protein BDN72DRAFT_906363 [Pluteus cervinus]|uniref:Uncharacterized protein n=1 Tax=Pluteus cervinus TaxID=181527 RepID=A0ACD3A0K3_9AGAR|nr:hypothetical protein BDN72DRAFT_906363 [Pluteus cervinus]